MQETESWEREVIFNRNRNSTYVNQCLHVANKFEQKQTRNKCSREADGNQGEHTAGKH